MVQNGTSKQCWETQRFQIEVRKTKPGKMTLANHTKEKSHFEPMRNRCECNKADFCSRRACTHDHVVVDSSFAPDWLNRGWHEFS